MRIEPALLSYASLACLALSTHRLRRDAAFARLPTVATMRAFAVVLLILAAWRAVHDFGPYQGPVAFIGMLHLTPRRRDRFEKLSHQLVGIDLLRLSVEVRDDAVAKNRRCQR